MASTSWAVRLRELTQRYGKVALCVHVSVSALSTTALYMAIKSNVDVVSAFEKAGLVYRNKKSPDQSNSSGGVETVWSEQESWADSGGGDMAKTIPEDGTTSDPTQPGSSPPSSAANKMMTGGALGLALFCNKALFPLRVPITVALTPPVARFVDRIKAARRV